MALRAAKNHEAATLSPGFSPGLHRDFNGARQSRRNCIRSGPVRSPTVAPR
jgi:hypothetical protein